MKKEIILENIEKLTKKGFKSAWKIAVKKYAIDLIEESETIEDCENTTQIKKALLNGAYSWIEYSYGGCALIYDEDIALLVCNNSELRRTDNGRLRPNKNESWLDVQARALYQANRLIERAFEI